MKTGLVDEHGVEFTIGDHAQVFAAIRTLRI